MAEPHRTYDQQQHVESHAPYGTVFFILLNFTALEYIYASFYTSPLRWLMMLVTTLVITLGTAVAAAFLHLEFNRRWVYLTLIPAVLLSFLPLPLVLGLMVLAITKAALVGLYFMHLKFEGNWVYYMLVPAAVLATVFIFALYPDIGMQAGAEDEMGLDEDEEAAAPLNPAPPRS